MTNPYPLPRSIRQTDILLGDGGTSYGPFSGFQIFDIADIEVWAKATDEVRFSPVAATVQKVNGLPLDFFTIDVPGGFAETTEFVVRSARLHERSAGVIDGTRLDPTALEKELSKVASVFQELRRELSSRVVFADFGDAPLTFDGNLEDGDLVMKSGGRLVRGPDAGEIQNAQNYAEAAGQAANAAAALVEQAEQAVAEGSLEFNQIRTELLEAIAGVDAAVELVLSGVPNVFPISRTALKALNTDVTTAAHLKEMGREGQFFWRAGDYSAQVAADTTEAIYVKADAVAASAGAWVRDFDGLNLPTRWAGGNWQAAIDLAAVLGIPTVTPTGTYTLPAGTSLKLRPKTVLHNFARAATLIQPNGSNTVHILDFATYNAAGAVVDGVIIDGNRSNNPNVIGNSNSLVLIYDTNDVTLRNCILRNGTGSGVLVRNALRYKIHNNDISNVLINGIHAQRAVGNWDVLVQGEIFGNRISEHGQHGIVVCYSDYVKVRDNTVESSMTRSGLNVMTSGNNVSSLSGAFFSPAMIGRFIILGGGFEFLVTGYSSPTSIVVSPAPGSNANLPAAFGQGDNYSIQGSFNIEVENNLSIGGVTLCYSVFADATRGCFCVSFKGNKSVNAGSAAYSVQVTSGGLTVVDTAFRDNSAIDPGKTNTAGAAATMVGIYVGGAANADGVLVDGNVLRSFGGMLHGVSYMAGVANKVTGTNLIKGQSGAAVNNP